MTLRSICSAVDLIHRKNNKNDINSDETTTYRKKNASIDIAIVLTVKSVRRIDSRHLHQFCEEKLYVQYHAYSLNIPTQQAIMVVPHFCMNVSGTTILSLSSFLFELINFSSSCAASPESFIFSSGITSIA